MKNIKSAAKKILEANGYPVKSKDGDGIELRVIRYNLAVMTNGFADEKVIEELLLSNGIPENETWYKFKKRSV